MGIVWFNVPLDTF